MAEPITLDEARINARVTSTRENDLINGWIVTGREWVEEYTGHTLVPREIRDSFDHFGTLKLSGWPIADDASIVITYLSGGTEEPLSGYRLAIGRRPALLVPGVASWRRGLCTSDAVWATYTAGYPTPAQVPAKMKSAILLIVKGLYDDRVLTPEVEAAAKALCRHYRLRRV
jgi:uncharacterized phiE125 gp8 family phage protein